MDKFVVKEAECEKCLHQEVCLHKKDFLDARDAVLNASVCTNVQDKDGIVKHTFKHVTDYKCIAGIEIHCMYYSPKQKAYPRDYGESDSTFFQPGLMSAT